MLLVKNRRWALCPAIIAVLVRRKDKRKTRNKYNKKMMAYEMEEANNNKNDFIKTQHQQILNNINPKKKWRTKLSQNLEKNLQNEHLGNMLMKTSLKKIISFVWDFG